MQGVSCTLKLLEHHTVEKPKKEELPNHQLVHSGRFLWFGINLSPELIKKKSIKLISLLNRS